MRPNISYEEQLKAEHRFRQKRMTRRKVSIDHAARPTPPAEAAPPEPVVEPVYRPIFAKGTPLWQKSELRFDDHKTRLEAWIAEGRKLASSPIRVFIRNRAAELGFTYAEILSPSKLVSLTLCRHIIMWEIKRQFRPEASWPSIGRIFNRDHSTVIHAVERIDRLKAEGKLSAPTMESIHIEKRPMEFYNEVLNFISGFIGLNDRPPTAREIAGHMGWSSTWAVYEILQELEARGKLIRGRRNITKLRLTHL